MIGFAIVLIVFGIAMIWVVLIIIIAVLIIHTNNKHSNWYFYLFKNVNKHANNFLNKFLINNFLNNFLKLFYILKVNKKEHAYLLGN